MPRRSNDQKIGSIESVNVVKNGSYLRISIAGQHFEDGNRQFLSLGLKDIKIDRADADIKAAMIRSDIARGIFDQSLDRYLAKPRKPIVEVSNSIATLWEFYLNYKSAKLKDSTLNYMSGSIGRLIISCPHQNVTQSLLIRNWLLNQTTSSMVKRILLHLNAAIVWSIRNGLCSLQKSPFIEMSGDLPKHGWQLESKPDALSFHEKLALYDAFSNHLNSSISHYSSFVKFLFLTGCRPSEAIGIRQGDIDLTNGFINFTGSIVRIQGKAVRSKGSKNNKRRKFQMNSELRILLNEIIMNNKSKDDLLFTGIKSPAIEYGYFSRNIWKPIATKICNRNTTPYSARDTFITEQLTAGIPAAKVAAWCDTSISQIQKRYFDPNRIDDLEPV